MENILLIMMYYKIRDKTNTEYYVGGTPGKFSYNKTGRIFKLGQLRLFLTNIMKYDNRRRDIGNWEIVELEMHIKDVKEIFNIIKPEKMMQLIKDF
jgi:hypothetical protein